MGEFWNWARTFHCQPRLYAEPTSIESLRSILNEVNSRKSKIRVVGCAHSPSSLSMSIDVFLSMKYFNKILEIDEENKEIHCESGVLLSTLNEILPQHNLSLPVQGSVSNLTIAGVISTATHGSGEVQLNASMKFFFR
jgi:FAD/FMN-containing dehydrogenase